MNWSRGFLRLWIIFTSVWMLGWAVAGYVHWPEVRPAAFVLSKGDNIHELDYSDRDVIQEAEKRGVVAKETTDDGDTVYWPVATTISESVRLKAVREFRAWRRSQEVREFIITGALGIVSLPAFFLLCGFAISWIIKGFRSR